MPLFFYSYICKYPHYKYRENRGVGFLLVAGVALYYNNNTVFVPRGIKVLQPHFQQLPHWIRTFIPHLFIYLFTFTYNAFDIAVDVSSFFFIFLLLMQILRLRFTQKGGGRRKITVFFERPDAILFSFFRTARRTPCSRQRPKVDMYIYI